MPVSWPKNMAGDNINKVFNNLKGKVRNALRTLPKVLGNEAVNWSKESFTRQGWLDGSLTSWPTRKKNTRAGRSILVKTGFMRRSIRLISSNDTSSVFGTDDPKAKAHNNGFKGTVQVPSYTRKVFRKQKEGTGVYNVKTRRERMRTVTTSTGSVQVKAHSRQMNMPQRKFMGKSQHLITRLSAVGKTHLFTKLK